MQAGEKTLGGVQCRLQNWRPQREKIATFMIGSLPWVLLPGASDTTFMLYHFAVPVQKYCVKAPLLLVLGFPDAGFKSHGGVFGMSKVKR